MRRFICAALAALYLTIPALAVEALPEESFSLSCTAAVLMERQTGTVLYEKESHRHLSPASVTKVMTLLLVAEAVENGAVSPDDPITASRRAASMGGSQIWLEEGEVMTVAEMTKCVAVVSANDCAVALAEALCGSEEAFVARMNRRAEELGLADTHFTNCTGLFEDAEHYTCAYDIAVMSRELLKHEFVRQYMTLWQDTIRAGEFGLTNTNKLVRQYNGCTGLKTGFTSTAMYCLAASAERGGVEYIAVILHGETSQLRFDAARTLLDYAFANYTLVMPETGAPDVPVSLGKAASVCAVCESSAEGAFRRLRAAGKGGCARRRRAASRYAPVRCRRRNRGERSDLRGGSRGARQPRGAVDAARRGAVRANEYAIVHLASERRRVYNNANGRN